MRLYRFRVLNYRRLNMCPNDSLTDRLTDRVFHFDDAPGVHPASDFFAPDFDDGIGATDGERNRFSKLLVLPLEILVLVTLAFGDIVRLRKRKKHPNQPKNVVCLETILLR